MNLVIFFNTPFKNKEDELLLFTPQIRDSQKPSKKQFISYSEEKPLKKLSESVMEYLKPHCEQKNTQIELIGDNYDPRNEVKEEIDPRYKRNRRAIISNANKRGTTIKIENLKKYNIKKVDDKYV